MKSPLRANRWRNCFSLAYVDRLCRIPKRPIPASESGVLRGEGATATPSCSPNGKETGNGMGRAWGSWGST